MFWNVKLGSFLSQANVSFQGPIPCKHSQWGLYLLSPYSVASPRNIVKISNLLQNTILLFKAKRRSQELKTIPRAWCLLSFYFESSSFPHMVDCQLHFLLVSREHIAGGHYCKAAVHPWLYVSVMEIPRKVWTGKPLLLQLGTLEPGEEEGLHWGTVAGFCPTRTETGTEVFRPLKLSFSSTSWQLHNAVNDNKF